MSKKSKSFTTMKCGELLKRVDSATDELAEVLADFDLSDDELISVRKDIKQRVNNAQELLLYGKIESC